MGTRSIFRIVAACAWAAFCAASIAADAPARSSAKTATDKETERGRYVVAISGCNDCHTPGFLLNGGKTPEKDWLALPVSLHRVSCLPTRSRHNRTCNFPTSLIERKSG